MDKCCGTCAYHQYDKESISSIACEYALMEEAPVEIRTFA